MGDQPAQPPYITFKDNLVPNEQARHRLPKSSRADVLALASGTRRDRVSAVCIHLRCHIGL